MLLLVRTQTHTAATCIELSLQLTRLGWQQRQGSGQLGRPGTRPAPLAHHRSSSGSFLGQSLSPATQRPAADSNTAAGAAAEAAASAAAAAAVATQWSHGRDSSVHHPQLRPRQTSNSPNGPAHGRSASESSQPPVEPDVSRPLHRLSAGSSLQGGPSDDTAASGSEPAASSAAVSYSEPSRLPSIRTSVANSPTASPERLVASSPSKIPLPPNGQKSSQPRQRQQTKSSGDETSAPREAHQAINDIRSGESHEMRHERQHIV